MTILEKKEIQAVDLIRSASVQHSYVVSYSGGKDSDVLLHLFKKAKVNFSLVYRNTTIDPPFTLRHVKNKNASIIQPKRSFFELMQQKGLPSFARRFCCRALKEGYLAPYLALGIRAEESQKRKAIYKAPEVCRMYTKKKHTSQLLPLVNWTSAELAEYIEEENIQCHPIYYNESGKFCVNRRLGCMGCPLPANRSIEDFEQYPQLVRIWIRNLQKFRQTHPNSNAIKLFKNAYEQFGCNLFYRSYNNFFAATHGLFPIDWKAVLEEKFSIDL